MYDPWNAAAREQDSKEYLETFDAMKSVLPLGDDAPALVIVAHTRKPKSDERASGRALLNLLAGSYVLGSVPRCVFVMQAASDDHNRQPHCLDLLQKQRRRTWRALSMGTPQRFVRSGR